MSTRLHRAITTPLRKNPSYSEMWEGTDRGLIFCWERGREKRVEEPELAARAEHGELVMLTWKGGVETKLNVERKPGTLYYLATWQGLRGDDLDIDLEADTCLVCTRTGQTVSFQSRPVPEEDER